MDVDQKSMRKRRSYRSARLGSLFLAVITWGVFIVLVVLDDLDNEAVGPMYAASFFWPMIAYICHLKLQILDLESRLAAPQPQS